MNHICKFDKVSAYVDICTRLALIVGESGVNAFAHMS